MCPIRFLNRLLGLPVALQNKLFAYFSSVFRWVVAAAKARGQIDDGVTTLTGESLLEVRVTTAYPPRSHHITATGPSQAEPPEVIFADPMTTALSVLHSIECDGDHFSPHRRGPLMGGGGHFCTGTTRASRGIRPRRRTTPMPSSSP